MEQLADKRLEIIISEAIQKQLPSIVVPSDVDFDDIRKTIRVYMRQHPEVFWFSHQYRLDETAHTLFFKYNFTPQKKAFYGSEIEKAVKYLFQPDKLKHLSDLEKVAYVYKWIVNNTTYNEYSSFNQTIYSVLINRNSVCTGYAKTAQYLLGMIGIQSELVFGKFHADKSNGGRHGWNIVKIHDDWYHVDFCLADPSLKHLLNSDETPIERDGLIWNYFCKTTEYVLKNRSIEFVNSYPECVKSLDGCFTITLAKAQERTAVCKSDSGTSAKVYIDSFDKDSVIKKIRNNPHLIDNEVKMLQRLKGCKHIVKLKGRIDDGVVLEQLSPWSELLNSHYYHPNEAQLKGIIIQLTEGLIECKNKGITYSDIHYNNVFVSKDGTYKWGDFGIAFSSTADGHLPSQMIGADGVALGSRWFMAPETYRDGIFTESSAIYSLAMVAYFVMNNMHPPFWTNEEHRQNTLVQQLNEKITPTPIFADRYGYLWPIIQETLSHSIESRPYSFEEFINELNSGVVIIEDNPVVDLECCPTEMEDNDCPILIDVDSDVCINDSFAETRLRVINDTVSANDTDSSATTMCDRWGDGGVHDSDSFACTCGIIDWNETTSSRDDFAKTTIGNIDSVSYHDVNSCSPSYPTPTTCPKEVRSLNNTSERESYGIEDSRLTKKRSIWGRLFGKKEKSAMVNASAYAPAEISCYKHFLVRVFIHMPEESGDINRIVKDIDKTAVKKANRSLDIPIKNGDKITIHFTMSDGVAIDEPIQEFVWRGRHIECDFGCELTKMYLNSVLGKIIIAINNVPHGDLKFTLDVVSVDPAKVYGPVETRRYSKIFISYAHADYLQVRGIAEGCKMNGSDYFFDRHTLQAGDIFRDKIFQYIDNADLFVLCWSKNAAESEWVQIERKHALELIERGNHHLSIYPLSMPPEAPLPEDMSDKYNFVNL